MTAAARTARQACTELRRRGKRVGRKRVARLMRSAGLAGRCPRRFRRTTISDPTTQIQDLVQRQFRPSAPNQLWCADISYIRTWEGWLYLAVILDAYSRKVVGWALADNLRAELATAALYMALTSRQPPPGLVCHSDRGSQYTSSRYGEILDQHGLRQSIGRPGTCWDNAVAESFFATRKKELIYPHVWSTRRSARAAIFSWSSPAFVDGWQLGRGGLVEGSRFELGWAEVGDSRVATARIVESFDVVKDSHARPGMRPPAAAVDQLALERGEERFRQWRYRSNRRPSPSRT